MSLANKAMSEKMNKRKAVIAAARVRKSNAAKERRFMDKVKKDNANA